MAAAGVTAALDSVATVASVTLLGDSNHKAALRPSCGRWPTAWVIVETKG
jgi:hypothetical protein